MSLAVLIWIAQPLGIGLFLGVLLGFTLQPFDRKLRARGVGPRASALACVTGAMLGAVLVLGGLSALVVGRAVELSEEAPSVLDPQSQLGSLIARALRAVHMNPDAAIAEMRQQTVSIGTRAAGAAADVAGLTFGGLLALFFVALSSYYVLRHWEEIVHHAELLLPFAPAHTRAFLDELRVVGRAVLRGTVWAGLIQGTLAALGYWVTGVPDPAFYGALTCVASLVPAVGTLLIWVPAGIYLIASGHVPMGIAELVYGSLVVVGGVDYGIRPKLIGREADIPALLTFIALFGGLEVFGVIGLIVGPVLVTLALAVLRTYETQAARDARAPKRM